jgi:Tol biopolymer transport system component
MYTPYTGHFLSADGRYLVFSSTSQNLAPNSPNGAATNAYYIRDRSTRTTIRLDVSNAGNPGVTSHSVSVGSIVVSSDGRWVAFVSADRDLSPQSRHGHQEVYLRDLSTGALWLASESSAGEAGNNDSFNPSLTADGSLLAFDSNASNLAGKDANAGQCPANIGSDCGDIYLHENAGAAA